MKQDPKDLVVKSRVWKLLGYFSTYDVLCRKVHHPRPPMVRPPPPKSKIQPLLPIQIQPSTKSNDAQPNHRPHQHQAAANTMNNSPVPNPMASGPTSQIHTAPPLIATPTTLDAAASASSQPAAPGAEAKSPSPQQRALQQQIQAQLQSQLQAQLQAAAARGKQVNITPEMIQVRLLVCGNCCVQVLSLHHFQFLNAVTHSSNNSSLW